MAAPNSSFDVPYRDRLLGEGGLLTDVWQNFFRSLYERLYPLGTERYFTLVNNQSVAADITGLSVSSRAVSQAIVDFLIQRVTTGTGATELIEAGYFVLSYAPTSESWTLTLPHSDSPEDSGVTLSIAATGQVQYTSSDITGTASISRIVWRMRTLAGKSAQYSSQGAR